MLRAQVPALLLATAAHAEDPAGRVLGMEQAEALRGIGRLNISPTRFCTATLIPPDVILTAAHLIRLPLEQLGPSLSS